MTAASTPLRQERDRMSRRIVYRSAAGIALLLAAGGLLTWMTASAPVHVGGRRADSGAMVLPREIESVDQTLFEARLPSSGSWEEKRKRLESFAWVDRDRGLVTIPVERAMQLIVEAGHVE